MVINDLASQTVVVALFILRSILVRKVLETVDSVSLSLSLLIEVITILNFRLSKNMFSSYVLPTNITIHVKTLTVVFIVFEGLAKMHYLGVSLVCLLINILIFLKRKNRYISH